MHFPVLLVTSLAGIALGAGLSPRDCSRNNCNRAVGGTRKPGHIATASVDCSRILGSTVYQATITVYNNVTRTIGRRQTVETPAVRKSSSSCTSAVHHTNPDILATYATAHCDDLAEYSSACSCLGVLGTGTTIGITVSFHNVFPFCHAPF